MTIRESTKLSLDGKLVERKRERWRQLQDVRVRFRGNLAYVDGVLPDGDVLPLCRLRYGGSATYFSFAVYRASKDGCEDSFLPSGSFEGSPGLRLRPLPRRPQRLGHESTPRPTRVTASGSSS